jgi:hypothetical protein
MIGGDALGIVGGWRAEDARGVVTWDSRDACVCVFVCVCVCVY